MEDVELKKIIADYDDKLDKTLRLNTSSVKDLLLGKSQKSTRNILRYRIVEVLIFTLLALFLSWYVADHFDQTHLAISSAILNVFTLVALVGSIGQVVLLQKIDFCEPIVEIRKKIEQVNAHGLLFVKLLFLSAPIWWAYAIVGLDLFLDFDLYVFLEKGFVIRYIVVNFLLLLPLLWVFNRLTYKNVHVKWIAKTISVLAGTKTMKAMMFLNNIDEFND